MFTCRVNKMIRENFRSSLDACRYTVMSIYSDYEIASV